MRKYVLAIIIALPAVGMSQSPLVTLPPNNGSGGIFLDLTAGSQGILFTGFQTYFSSANGTGVAVNVYTRPGSYVGFQTGSAGWTLSETVNGTSAGSAVVSNQLFLANDILINSGQTMGIYLHATTTGGGIRYQGTGTTATTTFSNADLTLFSAHSRTGAVPFAGTLFTPRAFSGAIHYTVVPEPATMAALGLGVVALIRRRKRS